MQHRRRTKFQHRRPLRITHRGQMALDVVVVLIAAWAMWELLHMIAWSIVRATQ